MMSQHRSGEGRVCILKTGWRNVKTYIKQTQNNNSLATHWEISAHTQWIAHVQHAFLHEWLVMWSPHWVSLGQRAEWGRAQRITHLVNRRTLVISHLDEPVPWASDHGIISGGKGTHTTIVTSKTTTESKPNSTTKLPSLKVTQFAWKELKLFYHYWLPRSCNSQVSLTDSAENHQQV